MFNSLLDLGINEELQQVLVEKYGYDEIFNIACRPEIFAKNLVYLKRIGIKNIKDIVLNKLYVLRKVPENLEKSEIKNHIQEINEDIDLIDEFL